MIRNVFISTDQDGNMGVRLNYTDPERPVVKVLQHGNSSVGINRHGVVVYVRIENAHLIDEVFQQIQAWALTPKKTGGPSAEQKRHLEAYCLKVASEMKLAYEIKHLHEREVEFHVEPAA